MSIGFRLAFGSLLASRLTQLGLIFQPFSPLLFDYYFAAGGPSIRDTVASWLRMGIWTGLISQVISTIDS